MGRTMTSLPSVVRPNTDEVASEVMDGEAVLINLSNGMYYSIDGIGGMIWERIEQGCLLQAVCEEISARCGVEQAAVEADVSRFVNELLAERLVTAAEDAQARTPATSDAPPAGGLSYAAPCLNIYRDMGDLLALDPPMPGLKDIPWKDS